MTGKTLRKTIGGLITGLALCCGPALADTVVVGGLQYRDVQVTGIADGQIQFTTQGNEVRKPLAQVTQLLLDGEPAFGAAEAAYKAQEWDKAVEGYQKTVRSTTRAWLRDFCSLRLLDSANRGGRFDVAVAEYIAIAERSPEALRSVRLTMPKAGSTYLAEAVRSAEAVLARPGQLDNTRLVLLELARDLYLAQNDPAKAQAASDKLVAARAAANPDSPTAQRDVAESKLKSLHIALAAKDYDKVIQLVEKDSAGIVSAEDRADALFCLAEARAGKASAGGDANAWKEAALAYMRVVAWGPASAPQVPAALLKTASILETSLGDRQGASELYRQIQQEYAGSEAAAEAQRRLKEQR